DRLDRWRIAVPDRRLERVAPLVLQEFCRLDPGCVGAFQGADLVLALALDHGERALGRVDAGRLATAGMTDQRRPAGHRLHERARRLDAPGRADQARGNSEQWHGNMCRQGPRTMSSALDPIY